MTKRVLLVFILIICTSLLFAATAVAAPKPPTACTPNVSSGSNLVNVANNREAGSLFCLRDGRYTVDSDIPVQNGDQWIGAYSDNTRPRVSTTTAQHIFDTSSGSGALIQGLTVTGAVGNEDCSPDCGRGIGGGGSNLTIKDVRATGNENQGVGGTGPGLLIQDSILDANGSTVFSGESEGPVSAAGLKTVSSATLDNVDVKDNRWMGAWCDIQCDDFDIQNSDFTNNGKGGVSVEITDCLNTCLIEGNTFTSNGWLAPANQHLGFLINSASDVTVNNNTFDGHTELNNGQGIRILDDARAPVNSNNLVSNNDLGGDRIQLCANGCGTTLQNNTNVGGVPQQAWIDTCEGTKIRNGDDYASIVNNTPAGAHFCVENGDYNTGSTTVVAQEGDFFEGQPGTTSPKGPGVDPNNGVHIYTSDPGPTITRMLTAQTGANFTMTWHEWTGHHQLMTDVAFDDPRCTDRNPGPDYCIVTGSGNVLGLGESGPGTVLDHVEVKDGPVQCIAGMSGIVRRSEFTNCGYDPNAWGWASSVGKSVKEAEFDRVWVHDNPAVGLWCDVGCDNIAARTNGYWIHDSAFANNGRSGVRYEFSPQLDPGQVSTAETSLIENNVFAGNGFNASDGAGFICHDAQNCTARGNTFGAATFGGVSYGPNLRALQFSDGADHRTDMLNAEAYNNNIGSEKVRFNGTDITAGCKTAAGFNNGKVYCHDNF